MRPDKQIKAGSEEVKQVMQLNLEFISQSIIDQIMVNARKLSRANMLNATKDIKPKGLVAYRQDLEATMAALSSVALDQVRKEVPAAKNVKLMENEERLLFGEFERLPAQTRKRITASNQKIIGTQVADLEKNLFFTFDSATRKNLGLSEIEFELNESSGAYVSGNSVNAAARVQSARTVNDVRNAFFFNDEVLSEIEAFQFMNESPNAAICVNLQNTIFAKDDPNHFRYTGPLHYNCDSWMRAILKLKKGQEIEKLQPTTKAAIESIQFSEGCGCCA